MYESLTLKDLQRRSKSELIALFLELIQRFAEAKDFISSLQKIIEEQDDNIQETAAAFLEIKRQLGLRNKALFGSTSEKDRKKGKDKDSAKSEENKTGQAKNEDAAGSNPNCGGQDEVTESAVDVAEVSAEGDTPQDRYKNGHPGRAPLPDHLPRVETHYYPEGFNEYSPRQVAPEITESLGLQIKLYVKRDIRYKFATRDDSFAICSMPKQDPFYKFKASGELICTMMYLRFALHMPYYRVLQLIQQSGQSYSTLMGWASRFFAVIGALGPLLETSVLEDAKILAMDESTFKVLDTPKKIKEFKDALVAKGVERKKLKIEATNQTEADSNNNGKSQKEELPDEDIENGLAQGKEVLTGYVWTMLNPLSKLVVYRFSPSRASINATLMLEGFEGNLMTDAYQGYNEAVTEAGGKIDHSKCLSHARREIIEARPAKGQDPVLERIIKLIGWLYKIEADNKGLTAEELKKIREKSSARILELIKRYIEFKIGNYAPKEAPRKAMQYILNHWKELSAYPHILHSMIDNNGSERCIRPLTVARKNVLFLGSVAQSSGAMLLYSLVECCKMNGVDPAIWINDVIYRIIPCGKDTAKLKELLPHRWKPANTEVMQT